MEAVSLQRWGLLGVAAIFSLAAPLFAQQPKAAPEKEPFHPTRIIVKYAAQGKAAGAGLKAASQNAVLQQHGLAVRRQFSLVPSAAVLDLADAGAARAALALAPADRATRLYARIAALRATGLFEYVEPDYIRTRCLSPSDSAYTDGTLWGLYNFGQSNGVSGADIGAAAAWDITTGSTNVLVAIVDTGIRYTHQELASQMWHNPGEIPGNGIDDDGDGYIDDVYGINSLYATNNAAAGDPMDDNGHGSHVSGTIAAAANNGSPHVGVTWKARLMACKFLDASGGGYISDEIECLQYVLAKGARVINASYGSSYFSQTEYEALRNLRDRGVLLVAAAGNRSSDNDFSPSYPASYDLYNIISVAALDRTDALARFSNYGLTRVHLGAPGVDIFSSWTGADSAYNTISGTSMATPHVVGAAALVLARYPSASLTEVRRRLLEGAVPITSLTNRVSTGGRLNAANALTAAPRGALQLEVSPRAGSALRAGGSAALYVIVSDLLPVTNATVTATLGGAFTNLTLLDGGVAPDALARDGVYSATITVPTNQTSVQITVRVAAQGWPVATNAYDYPVVFPPPNDNFASRIPIQPSNCPVTVAGSNLYASKEAGEPVHAGRPDGCSVWWSWTAPASGPVRITTAGSGLDTLLAVYTGDSVASLTPIEANDDAGGLDYFSSVSFSAVEGAEYQIAVDGYAANQSAIRLTVFPLTSAVPLAAALDAPGFSWTTGGAPWLGFTDVSHDGVDAARSGPADADGTGWLQTSVVGPGYFSFWRKVSSESGYDYLTFSLNGSAKDSASGEVDWKACRYWLGVGTNTLRWTYSKDYSVSAGQDASWVDEVAFDWYAPAIPGWLGDLDRDGVPTVLDLSLLVGYLRDTNSLLPQVAVYADVNGDHAVNTNDVRSLADAILGRRALTQAADTDGDGIADMLEPLLGLSPVLTNSVGDEVADADRDFDGDGLSNGEELAYGLDPLLPDTDGDGWCDEAEISSGSNPLDVSSRPYVMVLASPPVSFVLPVSQGLYVSNNTVIASPPVSFVLPVSQGLYAVSNNTFIANPPIRIQLVTP